MSKTAARVLPSTLRQAGRSPRAARFRAALRRTPIAIWHDDVSDWAAALTYYAILALLPALLVTVALVGAANAQATDSFIADIASIAPADSATALRSSLLEAAHEHTAVWLLAGTGTISALWSASSYLAVFRRALHAMHGVPDTRPALRKAHIIVVTAAGLLFLLMSSSLALVLSGPPARRLGAELGMGQAGATTWAVVKWPVMLALAACLVLVLFHSGPKDTGRPRRALPGGVLAALLWLAASAGFAAYATHVASYSRLYGSLAGVVVFLVWVWLTNLALLTGAQFNAELSRPGAVDEGLIQPCPESSDAAAPAVDR
ncbi:YihY/virulence factor BrkB family protein [Streptomyces sp. NPDC059176]|uniref:YihY/virulence factor BrkB family protein n=1 Tax=unclassified Streptomyces TaxID=2593676 RepID=UPI0036862EA4